MLPKLSFARQLDGIKWSGSYVSMWSGGSAILVNRLDCFEEGRCWKGLETDKLGLERYGRTQRCWPKAGGNASVHASE